MLGNRVVVVEIEVVAAVVAVAVVVAVGKVIVVDLVLVIVVDLDKVIVVLGKVGEVLFLFDKDPLQMLLPHLDQVIHIPLGAGQPSGSDKN